MGLGELEGILNHITLTGAVEEFKYGNETALADFFCPGTPQQTEGGDTFSYDILKADRDVAAPRTPGAPTKRVALTPMGQKTGRCISVGEHKMLKGNRLVNLREPGKLRSNAKAYVARELRSLDRRRARYRNLSVAQMLTGTLSIDEDDVKASVDYEIPSAHKPTASVSWATASTDIPSDIDTWVDLIESNSGYTPEHAWVNRTVMRYMMANTKVKEFLGTGSYKAQIGQVGYIQKFHGITWHVYGAGYVPSGGALTRFIADDKVILSPTPNPDWIGFLDGSTMIAPLGAEDLVEVFGMHSWTQLEKDPAGYKLCDGDTFIPAIFVPAALVYADVTP